MLTQPEAADCDELFADLDSSRPGGLVRRCLGFLTLTEWGWLSGPRKSPGCRLTWTNGVERGGRTLGFLKAGRASVRWENQGNIEKYHEIRQLLMLVMTQVGRLGVLLAC